MHRALSPLCVLLATSLATPLTVPVPSAAQQPVARAKRTLTPEDYYRVERVGSPRISPDGQQVAVVIDAAFSKVWVLDVERGTLSRVSQLPGDQDRAAWMPDGVHVTFGIDMTGKGEVSLLSHRFDGTGSGMLVFEGPRSPTPLSWSPDSRPGHRRRHR